MDIKAYIESGVIESYVLGMADTQEAAELVRLSHQYPEIQAAIDAFERNLEEQALAAAVPPRADVKQALLKSLDFEKEEKARVVAFSGKRYAMAAAVILLIASTALNIYYYTQFRNTSDAYQALLVEKTSLIAKNDVMQARSNEMEKDMQIMNDTAVVKVYMKGVTGREGNLATVFWDSRTKDVYLMQNRLPAAPEGKQYQLWAIVDGKPVDAGMIDPVTGLAKMKNIPKASMFAITLEKKGGVEQPTMAEMYVAGKVG
ncbi:anti-sigma factor [Sediminibacterium roseum]|uniref:Anti-sigma factor n=1 Tax=Sediminibacterium roseum TaxID=1978412 RepID=A0ABW9ZRX8_9BACT|nr:anti-sigma factor [Sediminibacterium roseum]NCI48492.1 anti-sigma factor [Sediminibacterium roseum]